MRNQDIGCLFNNIDVIRFLYGCWLYLVILSMFVHFTIPFIFSYFKLFSSINSKLTSNRSLRSCVWTSKTASASTSSRSSWSASFRTSRRMSSSRFAKHVIRKWSWKKIFRKKCFKIKNFKLAVPSTFHSTIN